MDAPFFTLLLSREYYAYLALVQHARTLTTVQNPGRQVLWSPESVRQARDGMEEDKRRSAMLTTKHRRDKFPTYVARSGLASTRSARHRSRRLPFCRPPRACRRMRYGQPLPAPCVRASRLWRPLYKVVLHHFYSMVKNHRGSNQAFAPRPLDYSTPVHVHTSGIYPSNAWDQTRLRS